MENNKESLRTFRVKNDASNKYGIGKEIGMVGGNPYLIKLQFENGQVFDFHPSRLQEVIDCTPTWEGVLRIHLACYTSSSTDEARLSALKELVRMSQLPTNLIPY